MGHSLSTRRRRRNHHQNQNQNPPLPQHSYSPTATDTNIISTTNPIPSSSSSSLNSQPSGPPTYAFAANASYPASTTTTDTNIINTTNPIPSSSSSSSLNSQPSPSPTYAFAANAPYPAHLSTSLNYAQPITVQPSLHNGSALVRPPVPPSHPPPPYVSTKRIKNDVNVHKDSIRLSLDDQDFESVLVSFTFDALVDGRITISYFAKEGANCTFTPLYPEFYMPRRIPFQKGLGQKFSQASGTGVDLGFFEMDELSNPSLTEDIFPLVISVDSHVSPLSTYAESNQPPAMMSTHAQITQAVVEKNNEGQIQVRVIKQILWIDGVHYELRELYGIGNSDAAGFDDNDLGKECVICMTEPKDTAVLPCRHMCMCSDCAKALRLQSDKCPICRQPVQELIEIKADKGEN